MKYNTLLQHLFFYSNKYILKHRQKLKVRKITRKYLIFLSSIAFFTPLAIYNVYTYIYSRFAPIDVFFLFLAFLFWGIGSLILFYARRQYSNFWLFIFFYIIVFAILLRIPETYAGVLPFEKQFLVHSFLGSTFAMLAVLVTNVWIFQYARENIASYFTFKQNIFFLSLFIVNIVLLFVLYISVLFYSNFLSKLNIAMGSLFYIQGLVFLILSSLFVYFHLHAQRKTYFRIIAWGFIIPSLHLLISFSLINPLSYYAEILGNVLLILIPLTIGYSIFRYQILIIDNIIHIIISLVVSLVYSLSTLIGFYFLFATYASHLHSYYVTGFIGIIACICVPVIHWCTKQTLHWFFSVESATITTMLQKSEAPLLMGINQGKDALHSNTRQYVNDLFHTFFLSIRAGYGKLYFSFGQTEFLDEVVKGSTESLEDFSMIEQWLTAYLFSSSQDLPRLPSWFYASLRDTSPLIYAFNKARNEKHYYFKWIVSLEQQNYILVPLFVQKQLLGLCVFQSALGSPFAGHDLFIIKQILSYYRANLDRLKIAFDSMHRLQSLSSLCNVSGLQPASHIDEIGQWYVDKIAQVMRAHVVAWIAPSLHTSVLTLLKTEKKQHYFSDNVPVIIARRPYQFFVFEDSNTYNQKEHSFINEMLNGHMPPSSVLLPLLYKEQCYGVFCIVFPHLVTISVSEQRFLKQLAEQCAFFIASVLSQENLKSYLALLQKAQQKKQGSYNESHTSLQRYYTDLQNHLLELPPLVENDNSVNTAAWYHKYVEITSHFREVL